MQIINLSWDILHYPEQRTPKIFGYVMDDSKFTRFMSASEAISCPKVFGILVTPPVDFRGEYMTGCVFGYTVDWALRKLDNFSDEFMSTVELIEPHAILKDEVKSVISENYVNGIIDSFIDVTADNILHWKTKDTPDILSEKLENHARSLGVMW